LTVVDWLWALLLCGSGYVFMQYGTGMDIYELGIMAGVTAALIGTGWLWKPVRMLSVCVAALTLFALWRYGSVLANGETDFFLKFMLASQSAIMWMSALYVMATVRISRGEHVFIGAALLR